MKKILILLCVAGVIAMGCQTDDNVGNNNQTEQPGDDSNTPTTPDNSTEIASIAEQSEYILTTIVDLRTLRQKINNVAVALEDLNTSNASKMSDALYDSFNPVDDMIDVLSDYTKNELSESADWAKITATTMNHYYDLAEKLGVAKATALQIRAVQTDELIAAFNTVEKSMVMWVNEIFCDYCTIANIEARVALMIASITEESESMREECNDFAKVVKMLKDKMEDTYNSTIKSALTNHDGIINDSMAKDVANAAGGLKDVEETLVDIEERFNSISNALSDLLDNIESLTIESFNGDDPVIVKTSAKAATASLIFKIRPSKAVAGLKLKWEDFVKAKAFYSEDEGVDMPITSFEVDSDPKKGVLFIEVSGENLSDEFYTGLQSASFRLEISVDWENVRTSHGAIALEPKRWESVSLENIESENNKIYYTTDNCTEQIEFKFGEEKTAANYFGAEIVSHLYDWRVGAFVVEFEEDVTKINSGMFSTTLKNISIPHSVTSIGDRAFYACSSLVGINIPDGVTSIGYQAFSNCSLLKKLTIPDSVTSIGNQIARYNKSLTEINFPNVPYKVGYGVTYGCYNLEKITGEYATADGLALIREGKLVAIANGKITTFHVPEEVTSIGSWLYIGVNSKSSTLGWIESFTGKFATEDGLCLIDNNVLMSVAGKNTIELVIPEGVEKIDSGILYGCGKLESVTIPESVTSIKSYSFYKNSSLKSVYSKGSTPPAIDSYVFKNASDELKIYVPEDAVEAYKEDESWIKNELVSRIEGYKFE